MPHCVFMHKADSIYDDIPAERYQFPAMYLSRAEPCIGDWIVYLEPRKVTNSRGYFAVAKVEKIIPDPTAPGMFLALIEPGTYLDFVNPVPFSGPEGPIERGVLNEAGAISGRARAAVRPPLRADFARIVNAKVSGDHQSDGEAQGAGDRVLPAASQVPVVASPVPRV
ncbi:hypothetical protein [Pelagerythrobacter marinus]|uniref:hypothetical protein n=1 Tax=Pelagerythrobacter marinus TaxID=538382 RepID=UPI002036D528|nr:hypothetical protein [Pelagerythrobacter marinus]USA40189.1 hypothetical protein NCF86_03260 [Pelagerythrobacter marinus]WPZ05687.1 hypothetical protein T8T98_09615 [Pelagerythrobacter marinus]